MNDGVVIWGTALASVLMLGGLVQHRCLGSRVTMLGNLVRGRGAGLRRWKEACVQERREHEAQEHVFFANDAGVKGKLRAQLTEYCLMRFAQCLKTLTQSWQLEYKLQCAADSSSTLARCRSAGQSDRDTAA